MPLPAEGMTGNDGVRQSRIFIDFSASPDFAISGTMLVCHRFVLNAARTRGTASATWHAQLRRDLLLRLVHRAQDVPYLLEVVRRRDDRHDQHERYRYLDRVYVCHVEDPFVLPGAHSTKKIGRMRETETPPDMLEVHFDPIK